jgi:hypothetical protein
VKGRLLTKAEYDKSSGYTVANHHGFEGHDNWAALLQSMKKRVPKYVKFVSDSPFQSVPYSLYKEWYKASLSKLARVLK